MAIRMTPTRRTFSGVVWSIQGRPGQRRTRIRILLQGPYVRAMRDFPNIRDLGVRVAAQFLRDGAPVDTGMLRRSIRTEPSGPAVSLGPDPFDRTRLRAALSGRQVKRRRRGRPRLSGFYAIAANTTSRRPRFIDNAIRRASLRVSRVARDGNNLRLDLAAFQRTLGRTR